MKCRICGNEKNNKPITIRSTNGGNEEFEYFICNECETLQITEVPSDLAKYYSSDYYSLNPKKSLYTRLREFSLGKEVKHKNVLDKLMDFLVKKVIVESEEHYRLITQESKILDVGCGDGETLTPLVVNGYTNVIGIDPSIEHDIIRGTEGITVLKKEITQMDTNEKYDMIVFRHSLEHVSNPKEAIEKSVELLNQGGYLVILIPNLSNYFFDKFGDAFIHLVPPCHLFMYSYKSMMNLIDHTTSLLKLEKYETKTESVFEYQCKQVKLYRSLKNRSVLKMIWYTLFPPKGRKRIDEAGDGALARYVFKKI